MTNLFKFILYKATNKIDGKVYIGITSKTLHKRMLSHMHAVTKKKPVKTHFGNALRLYGLDGFIWEEILFCNNWETLLKLEIEFIAKYQSNNKQFGYNITIGGEGIVGLTAWNKGIPALPHVKENLAFYNKPENRTFSWKGKKRDRYVIDRLQEGRAKYFKEFGHPLKGIPASEKNKEASRKANLGRSPVNKGQKMSKEQVNLLIKNNTTSKPIIAINLESGIALEFRSIKFAASELGMKRESIGRILKGKVKNPKKYQFFYKSEVGI